MAKSYITKFAEYAKTCKSNLKNNLINKGITVLENDTLDTLINKVADVTAPPAPSAIPYGYTRDANLPDMDALFDADPLREVNGGEYRSCAYLVCLMYPYSDVENQQNISVYGSTTYPCKIVFGKSDRELSVTNTNSYNFVVNEDELYTLTDGRKVYVLKLYTNYSKSGTSYIYYRAFSSISNLYYIELITDNTAATLGSTSFNASYSMYERYVAPIHDNMYFTSLSNATCRGKIRIDGDFNTNNLYLWGSNADVEINGSYIGDSSTITVSTPTTDIKPKVVQYACFGISKLVAPTISQQAEKYRAIGLSIQSPRWYYYSSSSRGSYDGIAADKNSSFYIPDCYNKIAVSGSYYYLQCSTLHLPNTISQIDTSADITCHCPSVRNLTLSSGAYGLNETALTLEAPYYMPLLTLESIANLVTNLADRTGKTANTIKFNKFQKTLLTEEQLTTLQNKNWTVTFAL